LSSADWRAVAEAFVTLLAVRIGLRTVGFRRTLGSLGLASDVATTAPRVAQPSFPVIHPSSVDIVCRHVKPAPSCLPRAIVLCAMLRRAHIAAQLRIGVAPSRWPFAHAWVEVDGRPTGDPSGAHRDYVPLRAAASPASSE
jgi:hypothetical protein